MSLHLYESTYTPYEAYTRKRAISMTLASTARLYPHGFVS